MTKVISFGTNWSDCDAKIVGLLTDKAALKRYNSGKQIVLEFSPGFYHRGYVVHVPMTRYVLVGLIGWPRFPNKRTTLHFQRARQGGLALMQAGLTEVDGSDELDDTTSGSTQMIYLFEEGRRATLDVFSSKTRTMVDLRDSIAHKRVAELRFPDPAFADYDHLVRPDLVDEIMLAPEDFDIAKPNVTRIKGEGIYAFENGDDVNGRDAPSP